MNKRKQKKLLARSKAKKRALNIQRNNRKHSKGPVQTNRAIHPSQTKKK